MKEQLRLVHQLHKEKSYSMNKVLEQWFINKNNSFTTYLRAEQGLLKLLSKAFEDKQSKFQLIVRKLKEIEMVNGAIKRKSSFKKLMNTVSNKQQNNQALQYLERMTNSFNRQVSDYQKSFEKSLQTMKILQKQRIEVCQKQNNYFRNILIESIKNRCSLKEIYVLSNFVLRQAQKFMKLIRQYKELVKISSDKQQQILSSLIDNLHNCTKQFPEYSQELGGLIKEVERLLQSREIQLANLTIIDPVQKNNLEIKTEELMVFLSTQQQQIIWTSNVEGLETSFLNQMSTRHWVNIFVRKQNGKDKPSSSKAVITTDGYLLVVDKYKLIEYELKLDKIQVEQIENRSVNISKSKNGLLKLLGLQNICDLEFATEQQSQQFILHVKKFNSGVK